MKEIMIWWPAIIVVVLILYTASAIILERRVRNWFGPKLERKVDTKLNDEAHKRIEGVVRENSQMLKDALAGGERRLDRMEKSTEKYSAELAKRMDDFVVALSGRFDLFDTLSKSRYESLKKGMGNDLDKFSGRLSEMEGKLDAHLETNGNGGTKE